MRGRGEEGSVGLVARGDGWRLPEELWVKMKPLIPVHRMKHPLGCPRPRVEDRDAMDTILFLLRTGGRGAGVRV